MSTLLEYKYISLVSPRSVRTIKVEPALDPSAELRCELKEVSLDDPPCKYSALSYCWEGQIPDCSVLCAGKVLYVTKNCWTAMIKLRQPQDPVTLWIDSICINQANVAEKSAQVTMMGDIYKKADQVIVWLGEWDQTTYKAVEIIRDLGNMDFGGEPTHEKALLAQQRNQAKVRALREGESCYGRR